MAEHCTIHPNLAPKSHSEHARVRLQAFVVPAHALVERQPFVGERQIHERGRASHQLGRLRPREKHEAQRYRATRAALTQQARQLRRPARALGGG
jgi:hypothetical protein